MLIALRLRNGMFAARFENNIIRAVCAESLSTELALPVNFDPGSAIEGF